MLAHNLLNKMEANKLQIFTVNSNKSRLTIYYFDEYFIVYSSFKQKAKKYHISHIDIFLKHIEEYTTLTDTFIYSNTKTKKNATV